MKAVHFWFRSRRNYILQLLKYENRTCKILDVGCSSGLLLNDLANAGFDKNNLYGIDISKKAVENCKKNGLTNCLVMAGENLEFRQTFDIIIASDCLEHIKDDRKALKVWRDHLSDNGKLIVFVPANQKLWSYHDEVNMHYRRYTKEQLISRAKEAKLNLINSGHWNVSLFIPLLVVRKMKTFLFYKKVKSNNGDLYNLGFLNKPLLGLLNLENQLLKYIKAPFGISTYFIAKK